MTQAPTLDAIAAHVVATTASAGVPFRRTAWAATVQYVLANRQLMLEQWLAMRARRCRP